MMPYTFISVPTRLYSLYLFLMKQIKTGTETYEYDHLYS